MPWNLQILLEKNDYFRPPPAAGRIFFTWSPPSIHKAGGWGGEWGGNSPQASISYLVMYELFETLMYCVPPPTTQTKAHLCPQAVVLVSSLPRSRKSWPPLKFFPTPPPKTAGPLDMYVCKSHNGCRVRFSPFEWFQGGDTLLKKTRRTERFENIFSEVKMKIEGSIGLRGTKEINKIFTNNCAETWTTFSKV